MEPDQYFKNQKIKESNTALGAFGRGAACMGLPR